MNLRLFCPTGHMLDVDAQLAGRKIRCGACGAIMIVPNLAKGPLQRPTVGPQSPGSPRSRPRAWLCVTVAWAAWAYLVAVIAVWAMMRWAGDRWWLATLVLFGPRWIYLLPLPALVLLAAILRRRSLAPLAAATLIAIGPLAGFCIPWARLFVHGPPALRVLTCNVKGHGHDNQRLEALVRQSNADIVGLQGCWDENLHWPDGWHVLRYGELMVGSRFPLRQVAVTIHSGKGFTEPRENLLSCVATTPDGELPFATVHLQSPHVGIIRVLDRKTGIQPARSGLMADEIGARWRESEDVTAQLDKDGLPEIVVGDLNLPVESPIYRSYWSSWCDAFSVAGWGFGGTEWPRGTAGVRFGIRIDHILTGAGWRPQRCWVGPDVGSEHLPVLAELARAPAGK